MEDITRIAGDEIKGTNIAENPKYDWIDIVGIPQRPKKIPLNLYLATHSLGEGGWDSGFDRRPNARKVASDTGWHLGIEDLRDVEGSEYLLINNLDLFVRRIYEEAEEKANPYVVGVTGSVGKTTTVAFLEHLLNYSGIKVVRFYSKRLTPLSTMCHFINRVETDTQVVVMEYSAYMRDHVAQLAELLPPNIAFLTNIYETHLNPGSFRDKQDIFGSKIRIKPSDECAGFVNNKIIRELSVPLPQGWNEFEIEGPDSGVFNPALPPTLRTAELYSVGKILSEKLGIRKETLDNAYRTFLPKEKRIILCNYHGKSVFFHGETSGGSRLYSWVEAWDSTPPWIFLEEINFADEDPLGFIKLLTLVLSSDKAFILDTPNNRKLLPVPGNFVDQEEFKKRLEQATGYIVFHKALATRQENFDPEQYLNTRW